MLRKLISTFGIVMYLAAFVVLILKSIYGGELYELLWSIFFMTANVLLFIMTIIWRKDRKKSENENKENDDNKKL